MSSANPAWVCQHSCLESTQLSGESTAICFCFAPFSRRAICFERFARVSLSQSCCEYSDLCKLNHRRALSKNFFPQQLRKLAEAGESVGFSQFVCNVLCTLLGRRRDVRSGQSVCESLMKLGLQPCWAQELPSDASLLCKPKAANVGYEPVLSSFQPDAVRRLHLMEVLDRVAELFDVWLQRYVEDFTVHERIPLDLFRSMSPSSSMSDGSAGCIKRARLKANMERAIADLIPNVAFDVINAVKEGLALQFAADNEGDIQLIRFDAIACLLIDSASSSLADFSVKFHEDAVRRTRCLFDWASGCDDLSNIWGTGVDLRAALCASVKECVIQASEFCVSVSSALFPPSSDDSDTRYLLLRCCLLRCWPATQMRITSMHRLRSYKMLQKSSQRMTISRFARVLRSVLLLNLKSSCACSMRCVARQCWTRFCTL